MSERDKSYERKKMRLEVDDLIENIQRQISKKVMATKRHMWKGEPSENWGKSILGRGKRGSEGLKQDWNWCAQEEASVVNTKWARWEVVEKEIREGFRMRTVQSPRVHDKEFGFWEFGAKQWYHLFLYLTKAF